jgi:hypothetical protein
MQTAYNVSMLIAKNWETKRLDRAAIIKSDFILKENGSKQWGKDFINTQQDMLMLIF